MIQNKEGCLRQFDLVIYPTPFVVAIGNVEKEINRKYAPYNSNYNYIAKPSPNPAVTYELRNNKTGCKHILVWFSCADDCRGSYMAHECGHAALEIFKYIGARVDYDDQEPFCYLLGTLMRMTNQTAYEYREFLEKQKSKSKKKK